MTTFTYQESDMHRRYDLGRALTSDVADALMEFLGAHVAQPVNLIVDLGSGTGRFTMALSEAFAAQVLGVEPLSLFLETDPKTREMVPTEGFEPPTY